MDNAIKVSRMGTIVGGAVPALVQRWTCIQSLPPPVVHEQGVGANNHDTCFTYVYVQ